MAGWNYGPSVTISSDQMAALVFGNISLGQATAIGDRIGPDYKSASWRGGVN